MKLPDRPASTVKFVVPDASGRFVAPWETLNFFSEFLNGAGEFTVQYWDFAVKRASAAGWSRQTDFSTSSNYDGDGSNFGVRVVTVGGRKRVELKTMVQASRISA